MLYIHSLEYSLFEKRMGDNQTLKNDYPIAYKKVQNYKPPVKSREYSSFSEPFKVYIDYPEQIDNICLIMLVCRINCDFFDDIQNEKMALWKFNNWIEYGFEEFRYYPGTLNKGKGIINNRIIDYIMEMKYCQQHPLAQKSITMIKTIRDKY